jgi:two-component system, cell cycle sensor histidine kinase and response regulator CckA
MKESLEAYGYKVITALNGAEALSLFAKNCESIRIVVTDLEMPVMDGPATISALKSLDKDLKIIVMSGVQLAAKISGRTKKQVTSYLQKPFTTRIRLETLYEALKS